MGVGGSEAWHRVALEAGREAAARRTHTRRNGALREALKRFGFARALTFRSGGAAVRLAAEVTPRFGLARRSTA
jgi:hypothetical protein